MTFDWQNFTPASALLWVVLIGLAAAILLLFNGRVCGVSGIVGQTLFGAQKENFWRFSFLAGVIAGGFLIFHLYPALQIFELSLSAPLILLAGFLVGLGTQLGGGCTSGHGVCGVARLSKRSLIATAIFMFFGFATVYFMRHL